MATNEWIIHIEPTALRFGKCRMNAEAEIKQNEMEPNFTGQYEYKMPILNTQSWQVSIVYSAILLGPHYVSLIQSLFSFGFSDRPFTLCDPV